jgi:transposase-like protein
MIAAAELQRLYVEHGLSLSEIAARYGCSLTTVWRRLKAAGIAARPDGGDAKVLAG